MTFKEKFLLHLPAGGVLEARGLSLCWPDKDAPFILRPYLEIYARHRMLSFSVIFAG